MEQIKTKCGTPMGKRILYVVTRFYLWTALLMVTGIGLSSPSAETLTYSDLMNGSIIYAVDLSAVSNNSEDYTIYAWGDTSQTQYDTDFELYAAYSLQNEQPVENSGNFEISAVGGKTAEADDVGAYGSIRVLANYTDNGADMINNGSLKVTATGGEATSSQSSVTAKAEVYGISHRGDGWSKTDNTGNIEINVTGGTALGEDSYAQAKAIGLETLASDEVTSSGDIRVTSTGGTSQGKSYTANAYAIAEGIYSSNDSGENSLKLKNTGNITVSAKGGLAERLGGSSGLFHYNWADAYAQAYGIIAANCGSLINSGNITAAAEGGTSNQLRNSAEATGIYMSSSSDMINSGDIDVSAVSTASAEAKGVYWGESATSSSKSITNSGNIMAEAQGSLANAYGIYINGTVNLTNTGMIRASSASSAYEVYISSGTVSLSDTYNMVLDGSPEVGSIFIAPLAVLDLNNAKLTLSYVEEELQWDTPYKLFENYGTVSNGFGSVSAVNPNVTASYFDQGTTDASDDTVSLSYGREGVSSPFTLGSGLLIKSMVLGGATLDRHSLVSLLTRSTGGYAVRIADSDQMASDAGAGYFESAKKWEFFAIPYYSRLDNNDAFAGYRADSIGTSFGVERKTRKADYGFHLGYGNSDVDYTLSGLKGSEEEMDLFSAGMHALGRVDQWILRLRMTGFKGQSDYQGLTGLNLTMRETAEYDTYGISSSLTGGYLFKIGSHTLLPGIGLDHIWTHRDSFTTQAETAAWDLTVDSLDEHQVTALADIEWLSRFETKSMAFIPSVSAGVRHLLTDNELSITQSLAGATPFTATTFQDDLTLTLAASLLIETNRDMTMEIAYDGAYGDNTDRHSLWGKISFYF